MKGCDVPSIAHYLHRPRQEIKRTIKTLLAYSLGKKTLQKPIDRVILSDPVCLNKYRPKITSKIIDFVKQKIVDSKNPLQTK